MFCRLVYPDKTRIITSIEELRRLAESVETLGVGVMVRAELEVCNDKIDEYLVHKLAHFTKTITEHGCGIEIKLRRPFKPMSDEEKNLMEIKHRCLNIRFVGDQVRVVPLMVKVVENIEQYVGEAKI